MKHALSKWQSLAPQLHSVLRVVSAFMFMQAGTVKLFSFPIGMPPEARPLRLVSEVGVAGFPETFGGTLMLLGLFARPVAFILAGEMAVSYVQVHSPISFWTVINNGEPAVFYCFAWLLYSAAGAGPWSLDALMAKRRSGAAAA